jgi:hypothetical protein
MEDDSLAGSVYLLKCVNINLNKFIGFYGFG